jgi:hypothetical protein
MSLENAFQTAQSHLEDWQKTKPVKVEESEYVPFYGHGHLNSDAGAYRGEVLKVGAAGRLQRFRNPAAETYPNEFRDLQ